MSSLGQGGEMPVDVWAKTSSYAFKAPLSLAILTTLLPFLKRRMRACIEGLVMLFAIHLLFVFSRETWQLTEILLQR